MGIYNVEKFAGFLKNSLKSHNARQGGKGNDRKSTKLCAFGA